VSQAAVTKSLRLLEEEISTALLIRRSRGVDLTPEGERLLARARVITRQMELAHDDLRQARGDDYGSVRVGLTPFLTLTSLGEAFGWFRNRYPKVSVQLIEGLVARVLPRLRDGTLDIAVVAADVGDLRDNEFDSTPIRRLAQCVVVREGHPALRNPSAAALAEYEWLFTSLSPENAHSRLESLYHGTGVAPSEHIVLAEALAALSLLRSSNVVCVMPAPLLGLPEARGIVAVPTAELRPTDIELTLLTQPDVPLTPAAAFFVHCLIETSRA
jgi:DNA-binding transcriptional LysR family regulator